MRKKIMIVEDNFTNIKLYNYILSNIDAEKKIVKDGESALKMVDEFRPNVILLDIKIPKISGIEVAKTIRQDPKNSDIIIVAVTAYSMRGDKEKIIEAGCDHYISKPIDTRSFGDFISKLLKPNLLAS